MFRFNGNRFSRLTGAALLICAAGIAAAPGAAAAQARSTSVNQSTWSDGQREVRVVRRDGKTELFIDGRRIPGEHISAYKSDAERIELTEKDGRITVTVDGEPVIVMNEDQPAAPTWAVARRSGSEADAERMMVIAGAPRVMLGVTMDSEESDGREVTVLRRVIEGLPADRAGLRAGDVIVKIDGKELVSPGEIRSVLRTLEPGQTIKTTVRRDGQQRTFDLIVDEYNSGALGLSGSAGYAPVPGVGAWSFSLGDPESRQRLEAMRERMTELSAQLAERSDALARATGREAEAISKQTVELSRRLAAEAQEIARRSAEMAAAAQPRLRELEELLARRLQELPRMRFRNDDGSLHGLVFPAPAAPPTPGAPGAPGAIGSVPPVPPVPSVQQAEERLNRLDQRLERLERLLERVIEEKERETRPGSRQ